MKKYPETETVHNAGIIIEMLETLRQDIEADITNNSPKKGAGTLRDTIAFLKHWVKNGPSRKASETLRRAAGHVEFQSEEKKETEQRHRSWVQKENDRYQDLQEQRGKAERLAENFTSEEELKRVVKLAGKLLKEKEQNW